MKLPNGLQGLYDFLSSQKILLNSVQQTQLKLYLELLNIWSHKQNLVSRNDIGRFVERHFLPSIYMCTCLPQAIDGPVLDLGSGAGFPGVLIKILRPELSVTLLDSSRKKTLFLQDVNENLSLKAKVVRSRCEDYVPEGKLGFAVVVARSVARLKKLLDMAALLFSERSRLYTIKGMEYIEEFREIEPEGWKFVIHRPDKNWIDYGNYLTEKFVIEVER